METQYLAVDLGAESGRMLLGTVGDERVSVEEVRRFPNEAVSTQGTLRWDCDRLFGEIRAGLRETIARGAAPVGISTDAWGVDYVLLRAGQALEAPFHYRDSRTEGAMEAVFAEVPADDIFAATGIQFMPINTLYQLYRDRTDRPQILQQANQILNIGDYFNYLLSGKLCGEISLASTTQLFSAEKRAWAWNLIDRLHFPRGIFPALVPPGTVLGPLRPEWAAESGTASLQVVATCSHDTAAAVAATPGSGEDWAFLSSGTWSLLGTELREPIINAASRQHNFTNEAGYGGTILFRKNLVGLWILQECRRDWVAAGRNLDYQTITDLAEDAEPLRSLIHPADPRFGKPGRMLEKIAEYCRATGQPIPEQPGAVARCVLESLALLYALTLAECAEISGRRFRGLHIVGGGSRNRLLNQLTADACGVPVWCGPVEASALGNILIQARTLGHVHENVRTRVRRSFALETFNPVDSAGAKAARTRLQTLPHGNP